MEQELKKTCLHDLHVELGAKMSPFAGFDMPIQYTGIIEEHNSVRNEVGVFDVSHMGEITVEGPDAEAFIQYLVTNDISGTEDFAIIYSPMCYENGTVVDDLLIYRYNAEKGSGKMELASLGDIVDYKTSDTGFSEIILCAQYNNPGILIVR